MGRLLILMGLCFNRIHCDFTDLKGNVKKNQQIFASKEPSDDDWSNISMFKMITFQNLPGGDIRKSNQSEKNLPFLPVMVNVNQKHLNCSILHFGPSPPSFLPNNHCIAAYIGIGSNEYAACLWWAVVNSDSLWMAELRQNPNSLLTRLYCGGLAGLWSFLRGLNQNKHDPIKA